MDTRTPTTKDAGILESIVNDKYEFLRTQSLTTNFANLIAQAEPKSNRASKTKSNSQSKTKSHKKYATDRNVYTVRFENPVKNSPLVVGPKEKCSNYTSPFSTQEKQSHDHFENDMSPHAIPSTPISNSNSDENPSPESKLGVNPEKELHDPVVLPISPHLTTKEGSDHDLPLDGGPEPSLLESNPQSQGDITTQVQNSDLGGDEASNTSSPDIVMKLEEEDHVCIPTVSTEDVVKHNHSTDSQAKSPARRENGSVSSASRRAAGTLSTEQLKSSPEHLHEPNPKRARLQAESKARRYRPNNLQARASAPVGHLKAQLAEEGIRAAHASRLNPFALHPDEHRLLAPHIAQPHVTAYLNIRNRILRLWTRNALCRVTEDEAVACASSTRWSGLARFAYEWLVRRGCINFGCVGSCDTKGKGRGVRGAKKSKTPGQKIVVIGAGLAGIGCARQLDGLVQHYKSHWLARGQDIPQIVLLEARNRIGGRIYSYPLREQEFMPLDNVSPASSHSARQRCTAEMGAHIIIGFERGNPLDAIVRGQLALPYHPLKDIANLYDSGGEVVSSKRDRMVEALHNQCLDRAGAYRHKSKPSRVAEGDRALIEADCDPQSFAGPTLDEMQEQRKLFPALVDHKYTDHVAEPADANADYGTTERKLDAERSKMSFTAESQGWICKDNNATQKLSDLDSLVSAQDHPSLGLVMHELMQRYQTLLEVTPQDLRLINWHYANLEYANATNIKNLSLGGWDQDGGNEFAGHHAQVIGGYQQVPLGMLLEPEPLDLRSRQIVTHVDYRINDDEPTKQASVRCSSGQRFDADHIVVTVPLGVLKEGNIAFNPPLSSRKQESISKLGFGILNKCVLVYKEPFWDAEQDMFGLLRDPVVKDSWAQEDYEANRGRFYLFWNCLKTSGRPVLIALLAGDAAQQAETLDDASIVNEATSELAKIFKHAHVPLPQESIITRWRRDPFARGTYSYVGVKAQSSDYDEMAKRIGNLHFAGEATCASHPATVHGAYISGLRAASEIIDDLLGPIDVSSLLPSDVDGPDSPTTSPVKSAQAQAEVQNLQERAKVVRRSLDVKASPTAPSDSKNVLSDQVRLEKFELEILRAIQDAIGFRPSPPKPMRQNAFIVFTSENWSRVKDELEKKSSMDEDDSSKVDARDIRRALGDQWTALSNEEQKPYKDRCEAARHANALDIGSYQARLAEWDSQAMQIRRQYVEDHPGVLSAVEEGHMWQALEGIVSGEREEVNTARKAKMASGYAGSLAM